LGAHTLIPVMAAIKTPCIKVCIVEPRTGLCLGCGRTTAEIAGWTAFTDAERLHIMARLPARVKTMLQPAAEAAAL
jgi:predicted Fe-S protein YdhL (DUF1289 family)